MPTQTLTQERAIRQLAETSGAPDLSLQVRRMRDQGQSWTAIADDLNKHLQDPVSREALRRWYGQDEQVAA